MSTPFWRFSRISDPQLSPDGKWVAYSVQTIDLEKNQRPRDIFIVPLAGGEHRKIYQLRG